MTYSKEAQKILNRNVPPETKTLHTMIRRKKDTVFKPSDKDKQWTVTPKQEYIDRISHLLSDTTTYDRVTRNPLPSMIKDVEDLIDSLSKKYPWLCEKCEPYYPRLPEFYGLAKTHKNQRPPPTRPVVSQIDAPQERLAHFINNILEQAVKLVTTNVPDSFYLKRTLQSEWDGRIHDSHCLLTSDIKSLYTSIPLQDSHIVICKFIKCNINDIELFKLELKDFERMLGALIDTGYFRFNNEYFKQKHGLGMGMKKVPYIAIIYVYCTIELPLLYNNFEYIERVIRKPENLPNIPTFYRCIDDCFVIVDTCEETKITDLFNFINILNSHIQFT